MLETFSDWIKLVETFEEFVAENVSIKNVCLIERVKMHNPWKNIKYI